jgi:hypothetical protein
MKHRREDLEARGHVVNHVDDRTHEMVKAQLHQTLDRATGTIVERGNIARTPGPNSAKGQGCVPVHSGTRDRHGESLNANWRELAPDANPAGPLAVEPRGPKGMQKIQPSFGQRSRINDTHAPLPPGQNHRLNLGRSDLSTLGKKIMDEANLHSSGSNKLPEAPNYGGTVSVRPASK